MGPWNVQRRASEQRQRALIEVKHKTWTGTAPDSIYGGISGSFPSTGNEPSKITIAVRDTTYLLDFCEYEFALEDSQHDSPKVIEHIVSQLRMYSEEHLEKIMGLAMPQDFARRFPSLCPHLWAELDIIPVVLPQEQEFDEEASFSDESKHWQSRTLDEQAESMGRKCVRFFGPDNIPIIQVGFQGLVEVDSGFRIVMTSWDRYKNTISHQTVSEIQHYSSEMRKRRIKIAIFSATPQGGGVALMRHAIVRCSHYLGVDTKWYVPKPRPGVFNVTKATHNILQGVSQPDQRLSKEDHDLIVAWVQENAKRYWLRPGGPMLKPSEGGADFIIVDDPQMPTLIQIAKQIAPDRPVIFRSHIQIRSDLVDTPGSPQAEAWGWLWQYIKQADIFISHPVSSFVPKIVPREKVGYMPATTDWLDGLNKNMRDWDTAFYGRVFNSWCRSVSMPTIDYPDDEYIIQVARFDPSKGIPDVLESYQKFHERLTTTFPDWRPPKLLVCGHSSVDDPEGAMVYDSALAHVEHDIPHIRDRICLMRVRPSDQILNALISKAKIALQLSSREGFEVKVSEALHKGKPVIATKAGGIPLQIEHAKNGFLVNVGDTDAVAQHLFELWTDPDLYNRMSDYARTHTADEVSTVGSVLSWFYLASDMTKGEVKPNGRWIQDLARESLGHSYVHGTAQLGKEVNIEKMS